MSKYYKIGKTEVPFPFNVPVEITEEQFKNDCREIEEKANKKHLNFGSWEIPSTRIRVFGLVETNTIYGFNMD